MTFFSFPLFSHSPAFPATLRLSAVPTPTCTPASGASSAASALPSASPLPTGEGFLRHSPLAPALALASPAAPLFSSPLEALAFAPASVLGASLTLLLAGIGASLGLVGILSLVARLQPEGASFTPAFERLTSYECGFAPFGKLDQPQLFLFYKLAVFFVIFEAELIFLYPWALALVEASTSGLFFLAATPFLLVLYLGFFYEIDREALDF